MNQELLCYINAWQILFDVFLEKIKLVCLQKPIFLTNFEKKVLKSVAAIRNLYKLTSRWYRIKVSCVLPENETSRDKNVLDLHCRSRESSACSLNPPIRSRFGLSGLVPSAPLVASLLGLLELAIEKTPESAWLAGESLLEASRGDSGEKKELI